MFSPITKTDLKHIYDSITNVSGPQAMIRSAPAKVGLCTYNDDGHFVPSYRVHESHVYYTYPGVPIKLHVAAVDMGNNIVPSEIYASVMSDDGEVFLNPLDTIKRFVHTDACAHFTYRINLKQKNGGYRGKLPLYLRNTKELLVFSFKIEPCPLGYALIDGACQCNDFIKSLSMSVNFGFQCGIDLKTHDTDCGYNSSNCIANITITDYGWMGVYNTNLAFTESCPLGTCQIFKHSLDLFQQDDQCIGNRMGQVCSKCRPGYSVAFGTKHCIECSNMWLWTTLLYAMLGIVLVLFLYITHFTIDQGTIVGIFLFGNLCAFILSDLYHIDYRDHDFSKVFIFLLNLYVSAPMCFYNGMTEVVKTALQFVVPVYAWGIVLLLILLSKRSMYIANLTSGNSVQVLITLVHLSFIKILNNVARIFSPVKLYRMTNNSSPYKIDYMWYGNATIPYGGTVEHCLLLATASIFTVGFLLPYAVMSFAAPYCLRYRVVNRFRPIYETQYGPYKEK